MKPETVKRLINTPAIIMFVSISAMLQAQSRSDGTMPQYLFENFSGGDILMKSGQVQNRILNYNTVTGKMVYTSEEKYYNLLNPDLIDTVYMQNEKFIPFGSAFCQLLLSGRINLYLQTQGKVLPPGKPAAYGGTSQVSASNYVSNISISGEYANLPLPADFQVRNSKTYWLRIDNEWLDFTTEKQFLKLFPDKEAALKAYIKNNRIKTEKPETIVNLVKFCSGL